MATMRGGEGFSEKLAAIAEAIGDGAKLRVGFLENAKYPNGTPVAMVAAIQDFGAPRAGIPPRPFFRNMIAAKQAEWPGAIAELLKDNDYNTQVTLDQAGYGIEGQLRESIIDTNQPPLSPVTLMLRKMKSQDQTLVVTRGTVAIARARVEAGESTAGVSTKTLIETSHMINSTGHEVKPL